MRPSRTSRAARFRYTHGRWVTTMGPGGGMYSSWPYDFVGQPAGPGNPAIGSRPIKNFLNVARLPAKGFTDVHRSPVHSASGPLAAPCANPAPNTSPPIMPRSGWWRPCALPSMPIRLASPARRAGRAADFGVAQIGRGSRGQITTLLGSCRALTSSVYAGPLQSAYSRLPCTSSIAERLGQPSIVRLYYHLKF